MNPVWELRQRAGLTQAELAQRAGTSQPTIAAYESGARSPNLRTMRRLAEAAGLEMIIHFEVPLTREDRRSLTLHHAIAARLRADPEAVVGRARVNLEKLRARHPHAAKHWREWQRLLGLPPDELATAIVDPAPRSRDLRAVTPFAGVLTPAERAAVYRRFRRSEEQAA